MNSFSAVANTRPLIYYYIVYEALRTFGRWLYACSELDGPDRLLRS